MRCDPARYEAEMSPYHRWQASKRAGGSVAVMSTVGTSSSLSRTVPFSEVRQLSSTRGTWASSTKSRDRRPCWC